MNFIVFIPSDSSDKTLLNRMRNIMFSYMEYIYTCSHACKITEHSCLGVGPPLTLPPPPPARTIPPTALPSTSTGNTPYSDVTGLKTVKKDGKVRKIHLNVFNCYTEFSKRKGDKLIGFSSEIVSFGSLG